MGFFFYDTIFYFILIVALLITWCDMHDVEVEKPSSDEV